MMKKMPELVLLACLLCCSAIHPVQAAALTPDIRISIDNVYITPEQLQNSNYEVPVFVRTEQNVKLNAIEFGIAVDNRCRYEIETRNEYTELYGENLNLSMTCAILPDTGEYAWLNWAQTTAYYNKNSVLFMILVKVPESAEAGDVYDVQYLPQAPYDEAKKHVWYDFGTNTDYAGIGTVEWTDGSVRILEESEFPTETDPPVYSLGDVNDDGEIDILDVVLLNKAIFGKVSLTETQLMAADVNQNNIPDAGDALAIMKHIVALEYLP